VTFDYSNNNGRYVVGSGDMAFETAWSGGGLYSIHAYSDPPSIRSVALAIGVSSVSEIKDASLYDTSSRVRTPHLNEVVVWQNTAGYYLATKVIRLLSRGHGSASDSVSFEYKIAPNKSLRFEK
jgi:hypothetical protein